MTKISGNKHRIVNPYSKAMLDHLQNGPATLNMIIAEIGPLIPPGEAIRAYQHRLETSHRGRPNNHEQKTTEELVRSGRREILRTILAGYVRYGRIIRYLADDMQFWFQLAEREGKAT